MVDHTIPSNRTILKVSPKIAGGDLQVGALRCGGFTAPCVFDGPVNAQGFRAYVEQQLVPVLEPGDIVIMDNLGSHSSATVRQ